MPMTPRLTIALFVHMIINMILTVASSESRSQGSGDVFWKIVQILLPDEIQW